MKQRIKNWIIKWLDIDTKIHANKIYMYDTLNKNNSAIEQENCKLIKKLFDLQDRLNAIEKLIDIGVDVHIDQRNRNWAVICVNGKSDYIKFIDLGHQDLKDLQQFLSRYQKCNLCIDLPPMCLPKERFFKY